jgi:DNA-binding transcriptional regulator YhcF (GntR family)
MLEQIFGSKARVKILKTFLSKPEQKYYTRQLARDLELQVNSVRRELENLKKIGLIKEIEEDESVNAKKNDKKYYSCNLEFILFYELKNLFTKANLLSCQEFLDSLKETEGVRLLTLSGIFTGDTKSLSDLLIVGKVNKTKFLKDLHTLEESLNKEINYTIMDETEYEYRLDIHDIFLYKFKQGKQLEIINKLDLDSSN